MTTKYKFLAHQLLSTFNTRRRLSCPLVPTQHHRKQLNVNLLHSHQYISTKSMSACPDFEIKEKVQLHVHLDGSPRLESVLPIAQRRGIKLPVDTLAELKAAVIMTKPETLTTFLARFRYWMPAYIGDLTAIRQMASEFAEDMAADNVIYTEARYCPQLLLEKDSSITADQIVEAVNEEFEKAEKTHNIKLRSILCCIRSIPEIAHEVLRLCEKYKGKGVVAIDLAGDENGLDLNEPTDPTHREVFRLAKEKGIHRTVHAGENGPAADVQEAVDILGAERVGHGYRTLQDETLYQRLLKDRMHFECCPYSSIMTGACDPDLCKHPVKRFAKDNFSFSLNVDDPTVTGTTLSNEFEIVEKQVGVDRLRLLQAVFDGAHAAFLPDDEKKELLARLHKAYDSKVPQAKDF